MNINQIGISHIASVGLEKKGVKGYGGRSESLYEFYLQELWEEETNGREEKRGAV